jgi:glyoxylase-like metal-dependent hydrolase (beta-lactamase superfamily II)
MFRKLVAAALLAVACSAAAAAQDAAAVITNASKAMGAEGLNSITYSGSAMNGNFGQSKTIAGPLAMTTINNYTRAINFAQPASRATGATMPPAVPGAPPPQPGNFNQNITSANTAWTQQLEIWITPWGFLKGAAANNATVGAIIAGGRTVNVVTWSPAQKAPSGQPYRVVGYVNDQNMVERVETRVEHPVLGDLRVDTSYIAYKDFGGVKVPTLITQTRGGLKTFEATITAATPNPSNITALLTPPPPPQGARGGGGQQAAAAPPAVASEKLADGVYRITGGYVALAVEFSDHVVVIEGGQSEARGQAIIAEARRVLPGKPVRYVVNTHMHFDHSSGLAPFAAEGITIITHENNKAFLERALSAPRTLVGDALAKSGRKPVVESAADRRTLRDNARTIELYNVRNLEHSDGMLVAYLPKEKILMSADFNPPNPNAPPNAPPNPSIPVLQQNVDRLNLDIASHVIVHAPNPDRPVTSPDLLAIANGS